jgi:uncharacterized membrane protein YfcA
MELVAFTFAFVAVSVGAVVQGAVGYGLALVVVPVLALVQSEALPAVVLLLAMPTAGFMVAREWRFAGRAWAGLDSIGPSCRCAGGVGLLALIPAAFLSMLFGGSCWRPCSRASRDQRSRCATEPGLRGV